MCQAKVFLTLLYFTFIVFSTEIHKTMNHSWSPELLLISVHIHIYIYKAVRERQKQEQVPLQMATQTISTCFDIADMFLKHRLHDTNHSRHRVINNVRLVFGGWSDFGRRKFLLQSFEGLIYNHVFISFSAVQIYDISYIYLYFFTFCGYIKVR